MSDVSKTNDLADELRERAMIGADVDPIDAARLLNEAADALESAARVPVQGEREAVARVRAIHAPGKIIDVWGKSRSQADDFLVCVECTDPDNWWIAYPCATIAALDGAPEPEVKR